jgi:hypothetical protein
MFIYVHIYIHICIHTYIYIHIYIYINIYVFLPNSENKKDIVFVVWPKYPINEAKPLSAA